jgi:5-formyltetrahydrofolate cyclo-ligase
MPFQPKQKLIKNRYGILEPPINNQRLTPTWSLDLVLMPLVAFDAKGNRLGMGAGFYDRTFDVHNHPYRPKPKLLGLAYDFQETSGLKPEPWDVPLDYIVTPSRIIKCSGSH